jgi:hypothetical protein
MHVGDGEEPAALDWTEVSADFGLVDLEYRRGARVKLLDGGVGTVVGYEDDVDALFYLVEWDDGTHSRHPSFVLSSVRSA